MKRKIMLTGIIGILAGILMYLGDMFLYFTTDYIESFQKDIVQVMRDVSIRRLQIGGLLGPGSAFLYMIVFYHIYLMIKPEYEKTAKFLFALLVFGIIYGAAFHSHFAIMGFTSKFHNMELLELIEGFSIMTVAFMFIVDTIAYLLLVYLILTKKTFYPRWIALFSPIVLFSLSGLVRLLPQPWMVIIAGGWNNIIFIIFFTLSTIISSKMEERDLESFS